MSENEILKAAGNTPLKRLLLTHPHVDHVGSVDALVGRVPGLILGASERTIPVLRTPPDLSLRPGEVGAIRGNSPGIQSPVSLVIEEGDSIRSLLAISTPGHIHGHLAFSTSATALSTRATNSSVSRISALLDGRHGGSP